MKLLRPALALACVLSFLSAKQSKASCVLALADYRASGEIIRQRGFVDTVLDHFIPAAGLAIGSIAILLNRVLEDSWEEGVRFNLQPEYAKRKIAGEKGIYGPNRPVALKYAGRALFAAAIAYEIANASGFSLSDRVMRGVDLAILTEPVHAATMSGKYAASPTLLFKENVSEEVLCRLVERDSKGELPRSLSRFRSMLTQLTSSRGAADRLLRWKIEDQHARNPSARSGVALWMHKTHHPEVRLIPVSNAPTPSADVAR